jgi:hypothetical protein
MNKAKLQTAKSPFARLVFEQAQGLFNGEKRIQGLRGQAKRNDGVGELSAKMWYPCLTGMQIRTEQAVTEAIEAEASVSGDRQIVSPEGRTEFFLGNLPDGQASLGRVGLSTWWRRNTIIWRCGAWREHSLQGKSPEVVGAWLKGTASKTNGVFSLDRRVTWTERSSSSTGAYFNLTMTTDWEGNIEIIDPNKQ